MNNARLFCYILKCPITAVQIESVRGHICGEIQIYQAIVIEISCCNPSPVIEVLIFQNIKRILLYNSILKGNAGLFHERE